MDLTYIYLQILYTMMKGYRHTLVLLASRFRRQAKVKITPPV